MLVIQHAIHAGCVDSNDDVVVGSRNSSLPMKRVVHLSRFLLSDLLRPLYLSTRFYLTKYIQKKTHKKKKNTWTLILTSLVDVTDKGIQAKICRVLCHQKILFKK